MVGRSLPVLALMLAGCVSSSTVGYVDDVALPPNFAGSSHRAWAGPHQHAIAIELVQNGLKIVSIDFRVDGGDIYLLPRRVSSRGAGKSLFVVELAEASLPEDWRNRSYWLTGERFYPFGNAGFWRRSAREPSRRFRLELEDVSATRDR